MFRCLFLLFEQFGAQQKSFLPIWGKTAATKIDKCKQITRAFATCPPKRKGLWDMWKWRIERYRSRSQQPCKLIGTKERV
jgi:hypothetical protein